MKSLLVWLILGLVGCTYNTSPEDDDMDASDFVGKTGWSGSGPLIPGDSTGTVHMQADFNNPGPYTIQFNINQPNVLEQADEFIRTRAEIVWSVEGNSVRRTIDVVNGTSISGTGQAVHVRVFDESNLVSTEVVPYDVSMQTSRGTRAAVQQPPNYSLDQFLMDPSDQVVTDVPVEVGAISVSVSVSPFTAGQAILDNEILVFQTSESGAVLKAYDPRVDQWVPLASGCRKIDIVSALTIAAGAFLQITFGVDG
jgi:hypothetical protein